jgi:hypothetical protein
MRVINAVAMAGGFTYRAVEEEFVIQRDGRAISASSEPRGRSRGTAEDGGPAAAAVT